ncbi:MAG: TniB family NTP-binding protein [Clostridia bacterium]|nr:TniB family NTP-binding protein [Clostridia bacterium]
MDDILKLLPPMLFGEELEEALKILPPYDESIRMQDATTRLLALPTIYQMYYPTQMSKEIYSKLYLALVRSLEKKQKISMTQQYYKNLEMVRGKEFSGTVSYGDSFSVLGESGAGKTSAVSRAVNVIGGDRVIELNNPYRKVIPCLIVQTPHDSSVKGLLIEILRKIDEHLETQYYLQAIRYHSTVDMLIGAVSQSLLTHTQILVLEEFQHLLNNYHNAQRLIGALVQLINNSHVTICMVGMSVCTEFFKKEQHLARRALGVQCHAMKYGEEFYGFCETLFRYQYVRNVSNIDEAIVHWLYDHSNGNPSVVVSLITMAQENSILDGTEVLNIHSLNEAYKKMDLLHGFIKTEKAPKTAVSKQDRLKLPQSSSGITQESTLTMIIAEAKAQGVDAVSVLRGHVNVEEVRI